MIDRTFRPRPRGAKCSCTRAGRTDPPPARIDSPSGIHGSAADRAAHSAGTRSDRASLAKPVLSMSPRRISVHGYIGSRVVSRGAVRLHVPQLAITADAYQQGGPRAPARQGPSSRSRQPCGSEQAPLTIRTNRCHCRH